MLVHRFVKGLNLLYQPPVFRQWGISGGGEILVVC